MENFTYDIPTKVYFGRGAISHLASAVRACGSSVLLVYGGGSIFSNGVYNDVVGQLRAAAIPYMELPGVQPNPRHTSIDCGVALCRQHHLDVILAVGGGSVIDCAKVIAACVGFKGNAWEMMLDRTHMQSVLPLISVVTAAGTGSEMDSGAVITNSETHQKLSIGYVQLYPRYTIADPCYTFSVPPRQTAAGIADMIAHVIELYFNRTPNTYMSDRMCEALIKTCIHNGPIAMEHPQDYAARAELLWASGWAINGFLRSGKLGAWSCHPMEHPLSAWYDITHGVGLAILIPRWMHYILKKDPSIVRAFSVYGQNIWHLSTDETPMRIAELAIEQTSSFLFDTLHLPRTLSDLGIDSTHFETMAKTAVSEGLANAYVPLTAEDVVAIYVMCL